MKHSKPIRGEVRSAPVETRPGRKTRKAILKGARSGAGKAGAGPTAARSQDFLYDEDGLPK